MDPAGNERSLCQAEAERKPGKNAASGAEHRSPNVAQAEFRDLCERRRGGKILHQN